MLILRVDTIGRLPASGMFGSASEVIREALRLFESYQSVQGAALAALKVDIEQ